MYKNSSGDEIPERDIDAVRYVASLLIAHTAVANNNRLLRQNSSKHLKKDNYTKQLKTTTNTCHMRIEYYVH